MLSRLSTAERIGGAASIAGIVSSFLVWYGYQDGGSSITVNGFRASLLGDVYFIASVLFLTLVASQARLISIRRIDPRAWSATAITAGVAVALQLVLAFISSESLHRGYFLALIAAAAMIYSARTRASQPYDITN